MTAPTIAKMKASVHSFLMQFVFSYLAGLLTLINPCVLPVLPIVLVSALNANRYGPLALAAGMSVSFVVFGVFVTAFGATIGLTSDGLAQIGAVMMIGFGVILVVPQLAHRFEAATAGMAARADGQINQIEDTGLKGQFLGGCCWARYGPRVSAQRWVALLHWRPKGAICSMLVLLCCSSRWGFRR